MDFSNKSPYTCSNRAVESSGPINHRDFSVKSEYIPSDILTVMSHPKTAFVSNYDYKIGRACGYPLRNSEREKFVRLFFLPKNVCNKSSLITLFYGHILTREHLAPINRKIEHETDWLTLALHNWYSSVLPSTQNDFVLLGTKFLDTFPTFGIGQFSNKDYLAKEEIKNEQELFFYYCKRYEVNLNDFNNIIPYHLVMDDITYGWLEKTILRLKDTYNIETSRNSMISIIIYFFFEVLKTCGPDNKWFYQYFSNDKNNNYPYTGKSPPELWIGAREKLLLEHKLNNNFSSFNHPEKHTSNYQYVPLKKKKKKLRIKENPIDNVWGGKVLSFKQLDDWIILQRKIAEEELERRYSYYD